MSVLYLTKHGTVLRITGRRFIVTLGKKTLLETPALNVGQVVIFGNALITPQALDYLLKNNISVAYMSSSGRYRGRLQPPISQNLPVRRAQYELAKDTSFCLRLSKAIVAAKMRNCLHLFTLLSLGYSLLFNLVHSMVSLVGLDPYQGFFHQHSFGHAALASDIMEPLRAPVVDALVLRVINLEIIKKEDFRKEGGKIFLRNEALKRYLEQYDQRLIKNRRYAPAKKSLNFKQILEWQCRHLSRVLVGKEPCYRPFLWGG